jgi:acetyltransferase-like isoleucine patch superfamily enzyme
MMQDSKETLFPDVSFGNNVQLIGQKNMEIGKGSCIGDDSWLNCCIRDAHFHMKIGECSLIGRRAVINATGYLEIGAFGLLAPNVLVSNADHAFDDIEQPYCQQGVSFSKELIIEENCWLGFNSSILGGITIGRGSVIGANANVTKDIPPFSVVVGNPGRIVKMYDPVLKKWVKTTANEERLLVQAHRNQSPFPSREEYREMLKKKAKIKNIDPLVAGRGICL